MLQGLVKWVNFPIENATWEDQAFLYAQFLDFQPFWGQEGSHGEGIVVYRRKRKNN